jgi:hypothetical protein
MDATRYAVTDSESQVADVLANSSLGTRFSKKVVAAVLAGAAVLLAPVAIHLAQPTLLQQGELESVQIDAETFGPKLDECADTTKNCFQNKCCKTTGYSCFQTGPTTAKCAAACPPGSSCQTLVPYYKSKPAWTAGDSMYCYMFYQVQRGATPKLADNPKELEIIKYQKANGLGVFGCDDYKVFSDKVVDIGGLSTAAVLISPDFTKYTRKDKPDRYLNTPLFMDMWKQIAAENKYSLYAWTVKADAATVFLPGLLKKRLSVYPETETGVYLETCNKVLQGYFGNLEVVSKAGMKRFLEQSQNYYINGGKCWRWDTEPCKKQWKYGPWGEDLFMQKCMDDAEVQKKADFTLTDTGTCPGMRPKTDKKNSSYVPSCTDAGVKKFVAVHPMRTLAAWKDCYSAFSR